MRDERVSQSVVSAVVFVVYLLGRGRKTKCAKDYLPNMDRRNDNKKQHRQNITLSKYIWSQWTIDLNAMIGDTFTVKSPETPKTCKLDHVIHLCTALSLITLLNTFQVEIYLNYFDWIYTITFMFCATTIKSIVMQSSNETYIQEFGSVTFVPFGILVEEYTMIGCKGKQRRKRYKSEFIPRENIIDVIVMEVVHSYKVSSVLAFRIKKMSENVDDTLDLIASGTYELRPLYERITMTYTECLRIRKGIQIAMANS
jgi:hypothetical protein